MVVEFTTIELNKSVREADKSQFFFGLSVSGSVLGLRRKYGC